MGGSQGLGQQPSWLFQGVSGLADTNDLRTKGDPGVELCQWLRITEERKGEGARDSNTDGRAAPALVSLSTFPGHCTTARLPFLLWIMLWSEQTI